MSRQEQIVKPGAVVLTDALVRRAAARDTSEIVIADAVRPGLLLRVRASGAKTWVLRRTEEGKQRRTTLGSATTISVAEARRLAAGSAPASVEKARTVARTAPLFRTYVRDHRGRLATRCKPSSVRSFDTYIKAHLLPAFGTSRLDAISAAAVADWFYTLSRRSPGAANRALSLLRGILGEARRTGVLDPDAPDPTASIRKNRPGAVGRTLTVAELSRLGRTLDRYAQEFPIETGIVRMILLTACRPGEIFRLRWENVKPDRLELEDSKTGPRIVPLSKPARSFLASHRQGRRRGYVFPCRSRPGRPRQSIRRVWGIIRTHAKLPEGFRLHDLRHTYASQATMTNEPRFMVSHLLGHRQLASTHRYTHLADDQLVAGADKMSGVVARLLAGARR
ncbi:MAG: tyrosine-type recombinase/integrase [Pseudomonadota bacterium]